MTVQSGGSMATVDVDFGLHVYFVPSWHFGYVSIPAGLTGTKGLCGNHNFDPNDDNVFGHDWQVRDPLTPQ